MFPSTHFSSLRIFVLPRKHSIKFRPRSPSRPWLLESPASFPPQSPRAGHQAPAWLLDCVLSWCFWTLHTAPAHWKAKPLLCKNQIPDVTLMSTFGSGFSAPSYRGQFISLLLHLPTMRDGLFSSVSSPREWIKSQHSPPPLFIFMLFSTLVYSNSSAFAEFYFFKSWNVIEKIAIVNE